MNFKKIGLVISLILLFITLPDAYAARVIPGTKCAKLGKQEIYKTKMYTCIRLGKKLYWDNGRILDAKVSASPKPIASPTKSEVIPVFKTLELEPIFNITTYSEELRRYKDKPDGYLYIQRNYGKVQIHFPSIDSFDSNSDYFVVIGGGSVYSECLSGELRLTLERSLMNDKNSVLYQILPNGPKGFPIGIVFKVPSFPITFECTGYQNETRYSIFVLETRNSSRNIRSKSNVVYFTTPLIRVTPTPSPTPSPSQSNTFEISPNAICAPEGASVKNPENKDFNCKKSPIDGVLRWQST